MAEMLPPLPPSDIVRFFTDIRTWKDIMSLLTMFRERRLPVAGLPKEVGMLVDKNPVTGMNLIETIKYLDIYKLRKPARYIPTEKVPATTIVSPEKLSKSVQMGYFPMSPVTDLGDIRTMIEQGDWFSHLRAVAYPKLAGDVGDLITWKPMAIADIDKLKKESVTLSVLKTALVNKAVFTKSFWRTTAIKDLMDETLKPAGIWSAIQPNALGWVKGIGKPQLAGSTFETYIMGLGLQWSTVYSNIKTLKRADLMETPFEGYIKWLMPDWSVFQPSANVWLKGQGKPQLRNTVFEAYIKGLIPPIPKAVTLPTTFTSASWDKVLKLLTKMGTIKTQLNTVRYRFGEMETMLSGIQKTTLMTIPSYSKKLRDKTFSWSAATKSGILGVMHHYESGIRNIYAKDWSIETKLTHQMWFTFWLMEKFANVLGAKLGSIGSKMGDCETALKTLTEGI